MSRAALAALLAAAAASGCGETTEVTHYAAAWADDGTRVLVVANHGTRTTGWYGHDSGEAVDFELWSQAPDGSDAELLARGERALSAPYYMRSAGYVVGRVAGGPGGSDYRIERFGLDGTRSTRASRLYTRFVPSPDGRLVALGSGSCDEPAGGRVTCRHRVTFIDAWTLRGDRPGGELEYDYEHVTYTGGTGWVGDRIIHPYWIWAPDSTVLYVQLTSGLGGVHRTLRLSPGAPPEEATLPCNATGLPPTTSSTVAADGRLLRYHIEGEDHVLDVIADGGAPYPGDCFP